MIAIAKNAAYERLYQKLETKKGEKDAFKLSTVRERRTKDLGNVRCIKDEDGKVLLEEAVIKERWHTYFYKLFNGEMIENPQRRGKKVSLKAHNYRFCNPISVGEIGEALRKITNRRVVSLDQISIEVWKCLGEEGVSG